MTDDDTTMTWLPIAALRGHPMNANVMPPDRYDKLVGHIERTGQYPPLIVRETTAGVYELLDGHHRCKALEKLKHTHAQCVVWRGVDDTRALVLLTTLNRLEGHDDPRKRGALLSDLQRKLDGDRAKLARFVPESSEEAQKLIEAAGPLPQPIAPPRLADMPAAVTFFLTGIERERLERVLKRFGELSKATGNRREGALMRLVDRELELTEGGA